MCEECGLGLSIHVQIQRWEQGVQIPPLKSHKSIGFISHSGPSPLKNHKATKPAVNDEPSLARWRADDGQLIVVFGSSFSSSTKKRWNASDKIFWICAWYKSENLRLDTKKA